MKLNLIISFYLIFAAQSLFGNGYRKKISIGNNVYFKVIVKGANPICSLRMAQYFHFFNYQEADVIKEPNIDSKRNFIFTFTEVTQPFYICLYQETNNSSAKYLLRFFFVEPGDSINLLILYDSTYRGLYFGHALIAYQPGYRFQFLGKGSEKYQCRYQMEKLVCLSSKPFLYQNTKTLYSDNYAEYDSILKHYRKKMSALSLNILKIDITALQKINIIFLLSTSPKSTIDTIIPEFFFLNINFSKIQNKNLIYKSTEILSAYYFQYLVERAVLESRYKQNNIWKSYLKLKNDFDGELRDRLLTVYALRVRNHQYGQEVVKDALSTIRTDYCINELSYFDNHSTAGNLVYNFSLINEDGKTVKFEDFKNKIVFLDFWFVGCSACSIYYKNTLTKVEAEFKNNPRIVFIAINVDVDITSWKKALTETKYTSAEAINLNTNGKGQKDPIIRNFRITGYPWVTILNKGGKILSNNSDSLRNKSPNELITYLNAALK